MREPGASDLAVPTSDAPGGGCFQPMRLLGRSPRFAAAVALVQRVAPCDAGVLIRGETGTGKELAARAIHYWSGRSGGPFVPVNCGAIPEGLVEAELFGHARGAFTDAREHRAGLVAQARGGTLFLDEIETLGVRGQIALLRFLQDQEYRPVGGALVRDADVRVIGATNADLAALAARGAFRQDLLFRLDVLAIDLPPLRSRGDDVILLAEAFLQRLCRRYGRPAVRLHPDAVNRLRAYAWPGNVRELENLMHRELVLADGDELRVECLGACGATAAGTERPAAGSCLTRQSFRAAKAQAVDAFERAYIHELLTRTRGNVSLAARLAGKERSRLGKLLRKHGVSTAAFRDAASEGSR